jgi:hypothetical protein
MSITETGLALYRFIILHNFTFYIPETSSSGHSAETVKTTFSFLSHHRIIIIKMSAVILFPWVPDTTKEEKPLSFKWTHDGVRHDFHANILSSRAIDAVVAHCVEVKSSLESTLQDEDLLPLALFNVFPRTLKSTLRQEWRQVEIDLALDQFDIHHFEELMTEFVATFASEQDRSDLVNQLRQPTKPREMTVQAFFSRLLELNAMVSLLPGDEEPLTDIQIKKAFYDGMPTTWKEKFVSAGTHLHQLTRNNVVRYFRELESLSNRKQQENEKTQKRGKNKRLADGNRKDRNGKGKRQDIRVKDSDPCPKHPHGSHTWGACRSRQQNQKPSGNKPANSHSSKFDKDKKPKPASSYVATTAEEVKSPSEGGTFSCFTFGTLSQLDAHLTSGLGIFDTQPHPPEDAIMLDTYYTVMEDSY